MLNKKVIVRANVAGVHAGIVESINGTECFFWPGSKDKDGYGMVKIKGKQLRAHRVALEIKIGRKLKRNEFAMHSCDNPPCINAKHLSVGDAKINNTHARAKIKTLADKHLSGWQKIY